MLVFTVLVGLVYPLAVLAAAQLPGPKHRADGSLVERGGKVVEDSSPIGQSFASKDGEPLARYFQTRPSAAGDGLRPDLDLGVQPGAGQRGRPARQALRLRRRPGAMPAATAGWTRTSARPTRLQIARVAAARGVRVQDVRRLVAGHTAGRTLGFLGEPVVNVVELNLALDRTYPAKA